MKGKNVLLGVGCSVVVLFFVDMVPVIPELIAGGVAGAIITDAKITIPVMSVFSFFYLVFGVFSSLTVGFFGIFKSLIFTVLGALAIFTGATIVSLSIDSAERW